MFALQTFTTIVAFLSFSVQASPLAQRDVVAPPIIKPDSTSIWPVGTQQTVIWDTSNLPPDSQITNPIGKIILGFNESNSLNLDFNHPLAQGFKIRDGNVTVNVPEVPPRNDYLIVLFGDSGDTSPAFAITRISSPGNSSSSASSSSTPNSSTVTATSLSITGSVTTAALTAGVPTGVTTPSLPLPTSTSPTGTTTGTTTTTTKVSTGSSSQSSSGSPSAVASASAGWSLHHDNGMWSCGAPLLMSVAPLVMLLIV